MDPVGDPASADSDPAEQAFENLRDEVTALRRTVKATDTILAGQAATAPDYNPTLGAMTKELRVVTKRLATIEAHPALQLTPEDHQARLAAAGRDAGQPLLAGLSRAQDAFAAAQTRLERMIGTVQDQADRRHERIIVAGTAAAAGAVLGTALFLLAVQLAPTGFGWASGLPTWLLEADGRIQAGYMLIGEDDPVRARTVADDVRLGNLYVDTLKTCEAKAAASGKEQRCSLTVKAMTER